MTTSSNFSKGIITFLVLAFVSLVAAGFWQRVFQPVQSDYKTAEVATINFSQVNEKLDPVAFRERLDQILSLGSRFIGQEGMRAAAELVRQTFEKAGLEIQEHTIRSVAPVTEIRQLVRPDSPKEAESLVEIYPFMPNHLQPMTTGWEGVTGKLEVLNEETINSGKDFTNVIGVIDTRDGQFDSDYGFNWVRYARLGIKALILTHPDGMEQLPWDSVAQPIGGMVSSAPVNFVRLAAAPGIMDLVGEEVRLRVVTKWEEVENTTYFGVLKAPEEKGATEAVVFMAPYDAMSVLPDKAPGAIQAISLASMLQMVEALSANRSQLSRDMIFMAYGSSVIADDAVNHLARILQKNTLRAEENPLLRALGMETPEEENVRVAHLKTRIAQNEVMLERVESILEVLTKGKLLASIENAKKGLASLDGETRKFLEEQFEYVLNELTIELNEPVMEARVDYIRQGEPPIESAAFKRYFKAKQKYDATVTYAGYSPPNFIRDAPELLEEYNVRQRFLDRIKELAAYHLQVKNDYLQDIEVARLFNRYQNLVFLYNQIVPSRNVEALESLTWLNSFDIGSVESSAMHDLLRKQPAADAVNVVEPTRLTGTLDRQLEEAPRSVAGMVDRWGYATWFLFNLDRQETYREFASPVVEPFMLNVESYDDSLQTFGESMLSLAHGEVKIAPSTVQEWLYHTFSGQVMLSNVGASIVPNHPLQGAIVGNRSIEGQGLFGKPGYYMHPFVKTNPYGKYLLEFNSSDWAVRWYYYNTKRFEPLAASYDSDGFIQFIKDEGMEGQKLFRSTGLDMMSPSGRENVTIVAFRADPMAVFDLTNPQTLKSYASVRMVLAEGLTTPRKQVRFEAAGMSVTFLEPDQRYYVLFQSGAAGNELVEVTRAFMLGITEPEVFETDLDIDGPGYLTADHAVLNRVPVRTANSMVWLNGHRLALQNEFHMADEQTLDYHQKAEDYLADAVEPTNSLTEENSLARQAVTYATLNHPVIRQNVIEAVISIVWYLGLLVPFVFFFEKLVFGFPDVRKQLAAQAIIFLVVFGLLRILHPAFEMVRSSLMILLGFFIILISGGITFLFSGKFKENLEEIRKKQGKVEAAEVNKFGVLSSAFMLGLNNMHRRKVRTGLTCATLTLLTFVMISFTSTQNTLVKEDRPIGKGDYQGMLIRKDMYEQLSPEEVFSLRSEYGDRFNVAPRRYFVGELEPRSSTRYNPELRMVFNEEGLGARTLQLDSILQLSENEPLRNELEFLTEPVWFDEMDSSARPVPILMPSALSDQLGISPEQVESGDVEVLINGQPCLVIGIFETESLVTMQDLNGLDLRPFDIEGIPEATEGREIGSLLIPDDSPRIEPQNMIISPITSAFGRVPHGNLVWSSVAITMPEVSYKEAREVIDNLMERTGEPMYYGLDGVGYRGKRAREVTLGGLVDLIIPLVLAGLTVLNTMKGSVYERKDEIYVYNAVGISPRYVFFMFMAEAMVYAVVGSVLGYLVSQGVGRILTELGLTGGLNMTYASLSTIYASLTIMAAVFISTYFPARSAMEIAKPADEAGWKLPEPEEDVLQFDLPFNFDSHQRMAVLSFFDRYLLDHSEGGAGRFFSSTPVMGFVESDHGPVPQIEARIWLKPFDLAVSQRMQIQVPEDPETEQFKARIVFTRLTGTREAWTRLSKSYVGLIRRHFLHWRAVSAADREEMFHESRKRFEQDMNLTPEVPPDAAPSNA